MLTLNLDHRSIVTLHRSHRAAKRRIQLGVTPLGLVDIFGYISKWAASQSEASRTFSIRDGEDTRKVKCLLMTLKRTILRVGWLLEDGVDNVIRADQDGRLYLLSPDVD